MQVTELSDEQSDRVMAVVFNRATTPEQVQADLADALSRELKTLRQIASLTGWIEKGGPDGPALDAARHSALEHLEWLQARIKRLEAVK